MIFVDHMIAVKIMGKQSVASSGQIRHVMDEKNILKLMHHPFILG